MESELINAKNAAEAAISYELNGNFLQAVKEYQKAVKILTHFIKHSKNEIMNKIVKDKIREYKQRVEELKSMTELIVIHPNQIDRMDALNSGFAVYAKELGEKAISNLYSDEIVHGLNNFQKAVRILEVIINYSDDKELINSCKILRDNYLLQIERLNKKIKESRKLRKKKVKIEKNKIDINIRESGLFEFETNNIDNENYKLTQVYRKLLEIIPDDNSLLNEIGLFFSKNKKFDKAIEAYKLAIKTKPYNAILWYNISRPYFEIKEFDKAIDVCKHAMDLNPNLAGAWNNLSVFYNRKDEYEEAIKAGKRAISIDSNSNIAWGNLSHAYNNNGVYDKAIDSCNRALEIDINDSRPWNYLGFAYYKKREYPKALDFFKKSITLDTNYILAWYNLAKVYNKLEQCDMALKAVDKCLEIDPNFEDVKQLKEKIMDKKGKE